MRTATISLLALAALLWSRPTQAIEVGDKAAEAQPQATETPATDPGPKTGNQDAASKKEESAPRSPMVNKPEKKPAPLDVKAAIRKAESFGSADKADRERLAALYLLDGQIAKAWKILRDLANIDEPKTPEESLATAVKQLRRRLAKMPKRGKGRPAKREETIARLRLAMAALALSAPAEALAALEPLKARARADKFELQRLALCGLAAWSAGMKDSAERDLESLLKKSTAGRRLALRSATLVDRVVCYGIYDERASRTVRVGESVIAYVEVLNFQCNKMDSGQHLTALNVSLVFEEETDKQDRRGNSVKVRQVKRELPVFSRVRHRTRSPLRDLHLVIRFNVPPELAAGKPNFVRIIVHDQGNVPAAGEANDANGAPSDSAILRLNVAN